MASLLVKVEDVEEGDVLLLPMGRTATVVAKKPMGPRSYIVQLKTEHGWTKVEKGTEVFIEARSV